MVFFFLFFFSLFVDDLHSAVFHLYHKLLLSYLLVLVNTVDFEICDCLGKLHLAIDVFAVHSVCHPCVAREHNLTVQYGLSKVTTILDWPCKKQCMLKLLIDCYVIYSD